MKSMVRRKKELVTSLANRPRATHTIKTIISRWIGITALVVIYSPASAFLSFTNPDEICHWNDGLQSLSHQGRAYSCAIFAANSWENYTGSTGGISGRCMWANCHVEHDAQDTKYQNICMVVQNPNHPGPCTSSLLGQWNVRNNLHYPELCLNGTPSSNFFFDPPTERCIEGCEYQCDSSQGGFCSPDPDTPFLTEFEPTGEVCDVPDHNCDEVAPGVFDCRPPPGDGDQDCQDGVGNPCNPLTGNKTYSVTDYSSDGLELTRTYQSTQERALHAYLGRGWSHNYAGYLTEWDDGLHLVTGNGRFHPFIDVGGSRYLSTLSGNLVIDETATEWILKRADRHEVYDRATSLLTAVVRPEQPDLNLSVQRDTMDRITEVRNAKDRVLTFTYDGDLLESVTTPDGVITFDYEATDSDWELVEATYPDAESEQYEYDTRPDRSLLTQVLAPGGEVKGLYEYDSRGRVTSSRPAPDIDGHTLHYQGSGKTLVVTPLGEQVEYNAVSASGWFGAATASRLGTHSETIEYADHTFFRPSEVTRDGQVTEYAYDTSFRETLRREAAGTADERVITSTWNDTHFRKASETRGDGQMEYQYNAQGQLIEETRRDLVTSAARTLTRQYCAAVDLGQGCPLAGLLREETRPGNAVTDYDYYLADAVDGSYRAGDLHTITNPLGHVTEFLEYDPAGRPLRIRDPNGVDTVMTYHVRGWLLTQTVAGATTSYDYLPNDLVSRITQPDGSFLDFEYDAAHRLEAIENALGECIEYELDAAGNRTAERIYDDQSTLSFELQQVYDQLGRLETTLTGTGHETGYEYDAAGNLTDVTDALDNTTSHEYDPLNRLKKTLDALGGETVFAYDARDNLVEVTDPEGLSTLYTYNAFDDLVELDSPDTGVTTYTYDSAGNRLTQTDARGVTTTYNYDALNRPTAVQYPDSSLDVAYFYDEDDSVTGCSGSYPVGRLTRMTDPSGTTVYCYDARGNVTHKQLPGLDVEISYEYNAADRLTAITYPSGRKVTYSRDTAGQITSMMLMTAPFIGDPLVTNAHYLPFGPVAGYTLGNGQTLQRAHNLNYHITDVTSPALALHFRRDPAGNIDRLGTAPGAATPLEEYAYDDLYRLLAVQDDLAVDIEAYAYDLIGNRQSKTTTAGTELYDYATGSHRLIEVGSNPRGYDAVGNLISDQVGSRTYTYGDHNRLTAFSDTGDNASYQYNGRGERAYKAVQSSGGGTTQSFSITNSTYFFYDEAGRLLAEHSAGMLGPIDTFREYAYLDDIPVALVEPNGDAYYLHADHLGTPRAVTDGNGTMRWEWEFQSNPFGKLPPDGDPEKTGKPFTLNLRFPGQYYDAESGLRYNYFRDYEPGIGRYIQSDPIGQYGGINTYSYSKQNPFLFFDRFGLNPLEDSWNSPSPPICSYAPWMCPCNFFPESCVSQTQASTASNLYLQCCLRKCSTTSFVVKTAVGEAAGHLVNRFVSGCLSKVMSIATAFDTGKYLACIKQCESDPDTTCR